VKVFSKLRAGYTRLILYATGCMPLCGYARGIIRQNDNRGNPCGARGSGGLIHENDHRVLPLPVGAKSHVRATFSTGIDRPTQLSYHGRLWERGDSAERNDRHRVTPRAEALSLRSVRERRTRLGRAAPYGTP
jgi:hypothetical protein